MNTIRSLLFLIVLLVQISCTTEKEPAVSSGAEDVINRYVDAIGGQNAIAQLSSRIIQGRQVDDRPHLGPPTEQLFTVWANADGYWRFSSMTESYGFDNMGGWRADSSGIRVDPWQVRSKVGFIFDPQSILHLDKYFLQRRIGKEMMLEYREVTGIYTDRDSTYYTLWFDKETDLINQIGYHWNLKNYRRVDGVLIPHLIEQGRKGGAILIHIDSISHNQVLPDSLFYRPSIMD